MEFIEAMEKVKKICDSYECCEVCPLRNTSNKLCVLRGNYDCDFEKLEKIISEWKPPVDWSKVAVDTPIIVWDDGSKKRRRYFAKYEDGIVYAWTNGCTSWTADGAVIGWRHAELAEVE